MKTRKSSSLIDLSEILAQKDAYPLAGLQIDSMYYDFVNAIQLEYE